MDSEDQNMDLEHQNMDSQHQDMYFTNLLAENSTQSMDDSSPLTLECLTTVRKSIRGTNFTPEEDKLLVSAWLKFTLDSITATDQKHSQYWQKIFDFFQEHKKTTTERTVKSLTHRWSCIQKATNNFCGYLAQVEKLNPSGTVPHDKCDRAKIMYQSLQKCNFHFEHCWELLKDKPKWINRPSKDKPKQKKVMVTTSTSSPTQNGIENEIIELERPMGRKAEKEKRKAGKQSEERIKLSKLKYTLLEESRVQEKEFYRLQAEKIEFDKTTVLENLRLKAEKLEFAKKESDERILMMDVNVLPELERLYFQGRKKEILIRWGQA